MAKTCSNLITYTSIVKTFNDPPPVRSHPQNPICIHCRIYYLFICFSQKQFQENLLKNVIQISIQRSNVRVCQNENHILLKAEDIFCIISIQLASINIRYNIGLSAYEALAIREIQSSSCRIMRKNIDQRKFNNLLCPKLVSTFCFHDYFICVFSYIHFY